MNQRYLKKILFVAVLCYSVYIKNNITTNKLFCLMIICFIVSNIDIFFNNQVENMADIPNESLQTISSIINNQMLTVTNLKVTGNLDVTGKTTLNDTTANNATINNATINTDLRIARNSQIDGTLTTNGKFTAKNGSSFSGGRHYFTDEENCGRLRVGGVYGKPGIYAEDGKPAQVQDFEFGLYNTNDADFIAKDNKMLPYIKSRLSGYALTNNSMTGIYGYPYKNNKLYFRYILKGGNFWQCGSCNDNLDA